MNNKYKNGKIYCIRSYQTDKKYYGSTVQILSQCFGGHKRYYMNYKYGDIKLNFTSFEILKYDDAYIELVELFPCNLKCELNRRKGFFIRNNDCVNKNIAGRSKKEYYEDNKTKIVERVKQYRENNKTKISEQGKRKIQCICGSHIRKDSMKRHLKSKKHIKFTTNNNVKSLL